MQKIWFVTVCLDRTLSANVLAVRLDPTASEILKTFNYKAFKEKLFATSSTLEPHINFKRNERREKELARIPCNSFLSQLVRTPYFKGAIFTLDRVIDAYLIDYREQDRSDENLEGDAATP